MNQLKQKILQITNSKEEKSSLYTSLFEIISKNEGQIGASQSKNLSGSILLGLMLKKGTKQSNTQFYSFLQHFIEFVYIKKSPLCLLVHQIIPLLLTKYIQASDQKLGHLQNCIKIIYNHQLVHFNNNLISRQLLMNKSEKIAKLYKDHFSSYIKTASQTSSLTQIGKHQQINSFNRVYVKSVLLLTIYNNLQTVTQKTVISYLWMVYVYCGGTEQEEQTGVSLYLLQKKNLFSIFKYYISVQQMPIILLTLFEMSMQRKKNKFQILSAINMIHKKAANESMFKLSEVAQSTIHLLEDEYSEAFS